MLKVLLYIPRIDAKSGGVGAFINLLSRDLGKLCELHIVSHHFEDELPLESCQIHYIATNFLPWSKTKKEYFKLLDSIHPDICHVNCCWTPLSSLVTGWSKEKGYKVVYSPHGMLEPYAIKRHYWFKKLPAIILYQKHSITICDTVHATAESEKKNLLSLGWNKYIEIVPNCIQIEKIQLKNTWKRNKRILFLSRIHPKKGIHFLIESIANLKEQLKDYECLIVGPIEGNYLGHLKKQTTDLGLTNIVKFMPPVYGEDKWKLYQESDVFVLPTLSENFGIVVAEALACGTPVITTVGTPWQLLNTEHCGWCTEIGTNATTNALKQFLKCSEVELENMGRKGRRIVEENFTSEAVAQQMLELYKKTLK